MLLASWSRMLLAPAAQSFAAGKCSLKRGQLVALRAAHTLRSSSISTQAVTEPSEYRFLVDYKDEWAVRTIKRAKSNKKQLRLRLDQYLSDQFRDVSRAQLQHGITQGLVSVNGNNKVQKSTVVRALDVVKCTLPPPPITSAIPEDIPLDIVYEDEHLLVINKVAGMVVHPAPGHPTGTLVNAVLHHCKLPAIELPPGQRLPETLNDWPEPDPADPDDIQDEEEAVDRLDMDSISDSGGGSGDGSGSDARGQAHSGEAQHLRPGVVHRLDKGTTGLIVMAKDAHTQWHLSDQFRDHTVERTYYSIALRPLTGPKGIVETRIGRAPKDRKKMAAFPLHDHRGRYAKSTFQLLEVLGKKGAASLVQWNLATGRTHQIRVHAQHVAHPLFGDETYGGSGGSAINVLAKNNVPRQQKARQLLEALGRPALHAKSLGFTHPKTGQLLRFDSSLPPDFEAALDGLRAI